MPIRRTYRQGFLAGRLIQDTHVRPRCRPGLPQAARAGPDGVLAACAWKHMNIVNAISKARFGSARTQRIQLHKAQNLAAELLCLEPGQKVASSGQRAYYVVTGKAGMSAAGQSAELPTGQLAITEPGERHTIANEGEGRLVVLAIEPADK